VARRLTFVFLLCLGLCLAAAGGAAAAVNQPSSPYSLCPQPGSEAPAAAQDAAMVCLTNAFRAQYGEAPLGLNAQLAESAVDKTSDILDCDSFSHTACGHKFSYWIWQTGYVTDPCWKIGENLAWGAGSYGSTDSIFRAWMRSPAHRANILGEYTQLGISTAVGSLEGEKAARVWTAHFGNLC
jgi:uncharacterized protein YkwD